MPSCPFCKKRELTGDDLNTHILRKHPEEATDLSSQRNTQRKKTPQKEKYSPCVVDGNNIAYHNGEPANVNNIKLARAYLQKQGFDPIIYISGALRHSIDSTIDLVRMINLDWVREVDGGVNDDEIIIEEANRRKCFIVSNDNFTEFRDSYRNKDWNLTNSIKKFKIIEGKFQLL
ncbi:MAG: hypothetical protein OEZ01_06450 [Candidatus Heimdallarchaeota archaeon]|nr:hypothetical protein [Candidatus Heimdallarchaeota archaeon]MDH5645628.1 hypothetical protein [Candidatus Heimdallarchaeota archaeon]